MKKKEESHFVIVNSPVGQLKLEATLQTLTAVRFIDDIEVPQDHYPALSPLLKEACKQLNEYFSDERKSFNLPLQPAGTEFERSVWEELKQIPYGVSITYKELAKRLGDENKVRAAGRANGKNPIPVIIPCHRVIGINNRLVGYGGGIERKQWLLRHEGILLL